MLLSPKHLSLAKSGWHRAVTEGTLAQEIEGIGVFQMHLQLSTEQGPSIYGIIKWKIFREQRPHFNDVANVSLYLNLHQ